ncbi:MAG: Asp-tRNA(Asn)/Glu-tRNA(Gln) amidotransferase subunit GatC [Saprospiraceae bacterium]|nr:Asp-tRNA(Asn)/Glu-tRNA(Gln) amidotransferase subunit GatC [Saprospiraceae bacterium]
MTIDEQLISRLENLARLELSEEERTRLMKDLNNILTMVEKMDELDTENVAPLIYINESEEIHALREDEIAHQVSREDALRNAPKEDGVYFRVPKVIDLK